MFILKFLTITFSLSLICYFNPTQSFSGFQFIFSTTFDITTGIYIPNSRDANCIGENGSPNFALSMVQITLKNIPSR